jgi:ParB family transcriptional regulator, chromosome partitioning protein
MPLGRGLGSLIPQKQLTGHPTKTEERAEGVFLDKDRVHFLGINKISPNPKQPRSTFEDTGMEELAASIKEHGIIQPLIVSPKGDNFELVAGERRLRAAKSLNLKQVPAIIRDINEHQKLEWALIENLQRKNLNPIEEAAGYRRLMDEFNLSQDEVSKKIGKSRPVVANMLRLLNLPDEMLNAVARGKISASAGRVLAGVKDTKQQMELYKKMLAGLTVNESEVASRLSKPEAHTRRLIKDPYLADLEDKLRGALETKVDIKKSGKTGKIVIEFYSDEDLKKIVKLLNC